MPEDIGYGDMLEGLSDQPAQPELVGEMGPTQSPGGPGIDTPEEQRAVQMLMQGAKLFRQAAMTDRSLEPIVSKMLSDAFLTITDHYGMGEEGKLALKKAQMQANMAKQERLRGGAAPPTTPAPPLGKEHYTINY